MFDRYTDRSRRVIVLSQEEARLCEDPETDVQHLLTAVAEEGDGVGGRALARLGLGPEALRRASLAVVPAAHEGAPATGPIPFTPRAKKAMELALRESLKLGHAYIGTEHLLLGLMRETSAEGSPCDAVLRAVNVQPGGVRDAVLALLRGYEEAERAASAPALVMTGTAARLARLLGGAGDSDLALAFGALGAAERERVRKALEVGS